MIVKIQTLWLLSVIVVEFRCFFDVGINGLSVMKVRLNVDVFDLHSLCVVLEGLGSVPAEYELAEYGFSREQMVLSLCVGYAASLFIAPVLGILADLM